MSRFGDLLRGEPAPAPKVEAAPAPKPEVKKAVKPAPKPPAVKKVEEVEEE